MEELMPVFRKVLPPYCSHRYEFDELLDEVWATGRVQTLPDIRMAYNVIRADVIDYMRRCEGRRQNKKRPFFYSLDQEWGKDHLRMADILAVDSPPSDRLLHREKLALLTAGCTRTEKLIISMLAAGFNLRDIARVAGYAPSRISQILTRFRRSLSARMKRSSNDE